MQNCVSSSTTNGTKSPVSPMIRPGLGPSRIHRCPCLLTRTCEKSILAEVGIRERELFIGTEFSILYTSMHSPA